MLPGELVESFDLKKLPSGPRVLSQLISAVRKPQAQIADIAELFRSDPALSARVVAACNSPFYWRGEPTADIREAVLQLGLNEVSRIVQVATLTDFKKYPTHLYTQVSGHYWERSLHTALVIDEISGRNPAAYTAGIMHLVGIWVLCSIFPAGHMSIAERELDLQAQLEQIRLGVTYAGAGGRALERWGFPAIICEAVSWQLAPSALFDPEQRELARLLRRAVSITDWHYGAKNERTLIRSDLTLEDVEACNERASEKVVKIGLGF
jgi:HD-like signal output (HDOD) protein